ncbi:MAG TPA: hypothetical protein VNW06_07490 [Cytophagaceae bacterium]|jgi:hypothetical protein|nr:hypothetical protein [Cytophagaceae bacterium]
MIQTILIVLIFIGALGYLIFMIRNQFISKQNGCPKGCGCSTVDLEKLEREMKKQSLK